LYGSKCVIEGCLTVHVLRDHVSKVCRNGTLELCEHAFKISSN